MAEAQSRAASLFGERLKKVRRRRGLSQEEVADLAEMHVTNIGKIERGQSNPSLTTIIRVAGVLDYDPGELLRGITLRDVPPTAHRLSAKDVIAAKLAHLPLAGQHPQRIADLGAQGAVELLGARPPLEPVP